MQHFKSFSMSQMAISYHCSIRESCLRKHYTTNQKTRHIPVKPRLYCLPCKLSSQIETAKNRCYNYASQMSIRSLVQIVQWQKKKTNKQTYPVQTSQLSVICNFYCFIFTHGWKTDIFGTLSMCAQKENNHSEYINEGLTVKFE